ncbi:MAG: penicillin-binding transpeptidase domain-containing protein, partial [Chitinophagales bacterium]
PLQTLNLYNAVANGGKMMKPYLVNAIQDAGGMEKQNQPVVMINKICGERTLAELKTCLEGVCLEGTAKTIFKNSFYPVAGKTGTALVANGNRGYADHIYQSSFVGYFPANHPKYSCIVVIKNKPFARVYYGGAVAGPVFKEVADKLMSVETDNPDNSRFTTFKSRLSKDSSQYNYAGNTREMRSVLQDLNIPFADSSNNKKWGNLYPVNNLPVIATSVSIHDGKKVPDVKGMGLKDALYLLESRDIQVMARGAGKVSQQSIPPGTAIEKNQKLTIELN